MKRAERRKRQQRFSGCSRKNIFFTSDDVQPGAAHTPLLDNKACSLNIFLLNKSEELHGGLVMRVVLQRSKEAKVTVNGEVTGQITSGLVLLVGVTHDDNEADAAYLADKIVNLRIFEDEQGKMNLSLLDVGGEILSISQFTLYGDCRKGRRPSFIEAARPEQAVKIYDVFNRLLSEKGVKVETGIFGAMMDVQLVNDGPVTLIIESKH